MLVAVASLGLDLEVRVLQEVGDLELSLRLHDLALAGLERLEARVRVGDVAEDDPIELHRGRDREPRVLRRRVIWTPFCQLWKRHGPLETGTEFSHALFMSWLRGDFCAW